MRRRVGMVGTMAILMMVAAVAQPVEAKDGDRARPAAARAKMKAVPPAPRPTETYDDIRANSQDPAGNYRGFPSWARAAFTNPNEP